MKIYNEVRMNLNGDVTYEDSFEYEGEVALCGGSDPKIEYAQSPEQREMYGLIQPLIRAMSNRAMNPSGIYQPRVHRSPQLGGAPYAGGQQPPLGMNRSPFAPPQRLQQQPNAQQVFNSYRKEIAGAQSPLQGMPQGRPQSPPNPLPRDLIGAFLNQPGGQPNIQQVMQTMGKTK